MLSLEWIVFLLMLTTGGEPSTAGPGEGDVLVVQPSEEVKVWTQFRCLRPILRCHDADCNFTLMGDCKADTYHKRLQSLDQTAQTSFQAWFALLDMRTGHLKDGLQ